MKFIDNAWAEFKRLWVIRVLIANILVNAALSVVASLQGEVSPFTFVAVNGILNLLAILLRMAKQETGIGVNDGTTAADTGTKEK